MKKRVMSLLIVSAMLFCLTPMAAMARDDSTWSTNAQGTKQYSYVSSDGKIFLKITAEDSMVKFKKHPSSVYIPSRDTLLTMPTRNYALFKQLGGRRLIGMWDIRLKSGRTNIPGSTLSFILGRRNAGQHYMLYHQKADGTIESFSAVANPQGIVSFYPINELSPFMLVQGGGIPTTGTVTVPATGGMGAGLRLLLFSVAGMAVLLVKRRKKQA